MTALPPEILAQLADTGISPNAVAERLGIGPRAAARMLMDAGAVRTTGRCYRIPSYKRTAEAGKRLANPIPASGSFEFTERRGTKACKKSGCANRTGKVDG